MPVVPSVEGHIEIETSKRAYLFLVHAREGVGHKYTMQRRRESEIAEMKIFCSRTREDVGSRP
jgi:hypothetical protein